VEKGFVINREKESQDGKNLTKVEKYFVTCKKKFFKSGERFLHLKVYLTQGFSTTLQKTFHFQKTFASPRISIKTSFKIKFLTNCHMSQSFSMFLSNRSSTIRQDTPIKQEFCDSFNPFMEQPQARVHDDSLFSTTQQTKDIENRQDPEDPSMEQVETRELEPKKDENLGKKG
jgi:hypothetical protein